MDESIMNMSLDEMREQFESYKMTCAQQFEQNQRLIEKFQMKDKLQQIKEELEQLRKEMDNVSSCEIKQSGKSCDEDVFAIKALDSISYIEVGQFDWELQEQQQLKNKKEQEQQQKLEQKLVISCGSSPCLFENCGRHIDSQLLLLHYLTDHADEHAAFQHCHRLLEGQRATLCLETRHCSFQRNHVIGLLAYGGSLLQDKPLLTPAQRQIYNSFLPKQHAHLECDVPVVVLICKTAANAALEDKKLARRLQSDEHIESQIFVIWLVTPHAHLELNAKLTLYGRDAAEQVSSLVAVRPVRHSQNTCQFMPVDGNYWRLAYDEMRRLSNGFRDELHLEVSLTHLNEKRLYKP